MFRDWTDPTALDRAAWLAMRILVLLAGLVAILLVIDRLRIVVIPIAVALLVVAPLRPIDQRLEARIGKSLAAVVCVVGMLVVVFGALGLAGSAVADQFDELRAGVEEGADDLESWLVERGIEQRQIDELRDQLGDAGPSVVRGAASGAVVVGEVLAGALLALILAIFILRDADSAIEAVARRSSPRRAHRIRVGADASWTALRRYLLGAATLGALEATVIGTTVALVGSPLAVPVATFTFLAAFVPIVGAVVAGIVAVLAALVSGGFGAAVVVAVVAVVVQQLDGDLLSPLIYGRATKLHPAAVLVAITAGTAVAGLAGAVLAVPVVTVAVAVARATVEEDDLADRVFGPEREPLPP